MALPCSADFFFQFSHLLWVRVQLWIGTAGLLVLQPPYTVPNYHNQCQQDRDGEALWYICSVLRSTVSRLGLKLSILPGHWGCSRIRYFQFLSCLAARDWFIHSHLLAVLSAHGCKADGICSRGLSSYVMSPALLSFNLDSCLVVQTWIFPILFPPCLP